MNCCIIGSGNVATHLADALRNHLTILQIYSRDIDNASLLASKIGPQCQPIDSLDNLCPHADLYLISVADDAILQIIRATSRIRSGIWAHTSGTTPIDVFHGEKEHYGVFYPLQTFSKNKQVEMSEVPMLIEGSDPVVEQTLVDLAESFSRIVSRVDSEGRKNVHIAAVFACNFVNYLWTEADMLLKQSSLDLRYLMPLLRETLDKVAKLSPREAQTGPARRGDSHIIDSHLAMLGERQRAVYRLLSDNIRSLYGDKQP